MPGRLPTQPPLTGPLNRGFCTIRRTATACRRRVAPLMLQFPPFARGNHGPPTPPLVATSVHTPQPTRPATPGPRGRQRRAPPAASDGNNAPCAPDPRGRQRRATPGRLPAQPLLTGPLNRGFCTIRRIATACRRRVAPLMLQFPPFATPTTVPPATSDGPHPSTTRPHQPQSRPPTHTQPPNGGFAPLDAPPRRVAGVSHP